MFQTQWTFFQLTCHTHAEFGLRREALLVPIIGRHAAFRKRTDHLIPPIIRKRRPRPMIGTSDGADAQAPPDCTESQTVPLERVPALESDFPQSSSTFDFAAATLKLD
jgi:hypothetical protein